MPSPSCFLFVFLVCSAFLLQSVALGAALGSSFTSLKLSKLSLWTSSLFGNPKSELQEHRRGTLSPALSPFGKKSLKFAASLPLFSVTTPQGSPFLLYAKEGTQTTALYFWNIADARALAAEFLQLEGMDNVKAKIIVTGFEKANKQVMARKLPTGNILDDGQMDAMKYRFVPSVADQFHASKILMHSLSREKRENSRPSFLPTFFSSSRRAVTSSNPTSPATNKQTAPTSANIKVPLFSIPGLEVKTFFGLRRKTPLFFSLDDLHSHLASASLPMTLMSSVAVVDFLDLLPAIDQDKVGAFDNIMLVPDGRGIAFAEKLTTRGNGRARKSR